MKAQVEGCLRDVELDPPGGVRARFRFPPELPVFAGHFPGRPLVPGVLLIEAARVACERATGGALRVARVVKAKFLGQVPPGADLEVQGALSGGPPEWTCRARVATQAGDAASLELLLREVG